MCIRDRGSVVAPLVDEVVLLQLQRLLSELQSKHRGNLPLTALVVGDNAPNSVPLDFLRLAILL